MKRSIMAGVALALSLSVVSISQAQQPNRSQGRAGQQWQGRKHGEGFKALLKGITLTDQQKAQLKDLRKDQKDQGDSEQFDKVREQVHTARANGDTATMRRLRTDMQAQMKQRREHEIAAIRGILTPEQRQ